MAAAPRYVVLFGRELQTLPNHGTRNFGFLALEGEEGGEGEAENEDGGDLGDAVLPADRFAPEDARQDPDPALGEGQGRLDAAPGAGIAEQVRYHAEGEGRAPGPDVVPAEPAGRRLISC